MKKLFALLLCLTSLSLYSQRPFEGHFVCKDAGVELHLNLYEENMDVPNFSFLGKTHGYMDGKGLYGTWILTRCQIKKGTASLRFSNDIGSDSQDVSLTMNADSTYSFHTLNGNALRKAVGRKLVKISGDMVFLRSEK